MIKSTLIETLLNCTAHGIPNVLRTKFALVRVIWTLCLLIFTGLTSWLILLSIFNYLSFEVSTKTRIFHERPTVFPTVTVCNANIFSSSRGLGFIEHVFQAENITHDYYNDHKEEIDFILASYLQSKNLNDEQRKRVGKPIQDFVLSCKFDDTECSLNEDFIWTFDDIYGNCFTFNSGFRNESARLG